MADRVYRVKLVGDDAGLQAATARAETALGGVSKRLDGLSTAYGTTSSALTGFQRLQAASTEVAGRHAAATQAEAAALERLRAAASGRATVLQAPDQTAALRALANIQSAGQDAQRRDFAQRDQFLSGLRSQADAAGKTGSQLAALRAAQMGVTREAAPYIAAMQRAEQSQVALGSSATLAARALGPIVGLLGTRELAGAADAWTNYNAKLRLASQGLGPVAVAQERLFAIAQDTRQPLEGLGQLYQRMAASGKELGLSQTEVIDTTETLSKAAALARDSVQGSNAALIQLGQGMSAGVLRGEELNSVLEQAPRLAKALADGLGVPVGALRELGAAGQITSQQIVRALASQKAAIDREFAELPTTVEGAMARVRNSFLRTVGLFDEAGGLSRGAASAITALADSMDTVLVAAGAGAAAWVAWTLQARLAAAGAAALSLGATGATTALAGTTAAAGAGAAMMTRMAGAAALARGALGLMTGPIGWIATALTVAVPAWLAWRNAGTESERAVAKQVDESTDQIIKRINEQVAALRERNRLAAQSLAPAVPEAADANRAGQIFAELESKRQRAIAGEGEFANLRGNAAAQAEVVRGLTVQVAAAYTAYTGAASDATERNREQSDKLLADVRRTAQTDTSLRADWAAKAADIARKYSQAIELNAGDPTRQAALQRERDQALIEGQRALDQQLRGRAGRKESADDGRKLADAKAAAERAALQQASAARLADIDTALQAEEARQRAGLASAQDIAQARIDAERARLQERADLITQEIALERRRPVANAAESIERDTRIADLTNRLAEAARSAGAAIRRETEAIEAASAEQAEAAYTRMVAQIDAAASFVAALTDRAQRSEIGRIADPLLRAAAEAAEERRKVQAEADRLLAGLQQQRTQTLDPAREAALAAQIAQVRRALADEIVQIDTDLAERLRPAWQRTASDWADTMRQMREAGDEFVNRFQSGTEAAFVEMARSGKLSLSSLAGDLRDILSRQIFRANVAPVITGLGESLARAVGLNPSIATAAAGAAGGTGVQALDGAAAGAASASGRLALEADRAAFALGRLAGAAPAAGGGDAGGSAGSIVGFIGKFIRRLFPGGDAPADTYPANDIKQFAKGGAFVGGALTEPTKQQFATGAAFTNSVVQRPTKFSFAKGTALGEMGEAGPEAIMPLTRTRSGALGVAAVGAAGGTPVNVSVNVVNNTDARVRVQERDDGAGGQTVEILIERAVAEVDRRIRSGGSTRQAIGGAFGLRPQLARTGSPA